jgi:hypothetical protein
MRLSNYQSLCIDVVSQGLFDGTMISGGTSRQCTAEHHFDNWEANTVTTQHVQPCVTEALCIDHMRGREAL